MRVMMKHATGRRTFENVEMIIADDKEIVIWQPNIGHRRGSRRTRFERSEVTGVIYVETNEKKTTDREVETPRS